MRQRIWIERDVNELAMRQVKCNFHTRLIINNTPSGQSYDFQPGEVQEVFTEDLQHLLGLVYKQSSSCCGGSEPQSINYFLEI